jgi:hypothetical protein
VCEDLRSVHGLPTRSSTACQGKVYIIVGEDTFGPMTDLLVLR